MSDSRSVAIVDLGLGNLHSVKRVFERAHANVRIIRTPEEVRAANRLVVPGQGAFRDAAKALDEGMGDALRESITRGVPFLGICLGMQLLFERSEEAPDRRGLGLFPGEVRRFSDALVEARDGRRLKVPHMGWNETVGRHRFLPTSGWFYFLHSYYCAPADPALVVGTAEYGAPFCAAVARENVFGCQFHPEKSHAAGLRVVESFLGDATWS